MTITWSDPEKGRRIDAARRRADEQYLRMMLASARRCRQALRLAGKRRRGRAGERWSADATAQIADWLARWNEWAARNLETS